MRYFLWTISTGLVYYNLDHGGDFTLIFSIILWFVVNLYYIASSERIAQNISRLIETWKNPYSEVVYYISKMNSEQLAVLNSLTITYELIGGKDREFRTAIVVDETKLWGEWISQYLKSCRIYYPELPSIREGDRTKEEAFQVYLDYAGYIKKRVGKRSVWLDNWTPEKVHMSILDKPLDSLEKM